MLIDYFAATFTLRASAMLLIRYALCLMRARRYMFVKIHVTIMMAQVYRHVGHDVYHQ